MTTSRYKEEDSNFRNTGDYMKVDGTLEVDGLATFDGKVSISAPAVTTDMGLTVASKMTTHSGVAVGAPSGTTAGVVWTTGVPAFTSGQKFIVMKCGLTDYRIPVWANS